MAASTRAVAWSVRRAIPGMVMALVGVAGCASPPSPLDGRYVVTGESISCVGMTRGDCQRSSHQIARWRLSRCEHGRCLLDSASGHQWWRAPMPLTNKGGRWQGTGERAGVGLILCRGQRLPTSDKLDLAEETGQDGVLRLKGFIETVPTRELPYYEPGGKRPNSFRACSGVHQTLSITLAPPAG